MKNRLLGLILTLVAFISFGFIVKAAETTTNANANVNYGDIFEIPFPADSIDASKRKHMSLSCKSTSDSTMVEDRTSDGGGFAVYANPNITSGNSNGEVQCTYTKKNGDSAKIIYRVTFNYRGVMTIRGSQTEDLDSNGDILHTFGNVLGGGVIKGSKVVSGGSYINLDCSSSSKCEVRLTDAAYDKGQLTSEIEITVERDGKTTTFPITIHINAWGSARAYPGGYKTCTADSNWEPKMGIYAGNINFWAAKTGSKIKLPTCSNGGTDVLSSGVPIKFIGWIDTYDGNSYHNVQVTIQKSGGCKDTKLGTFYEDGAEVRGDHKANYQACYEYKPMVRVAPGNGDLSGGGWSVSQTGIYFKEPASAGAKISLPTAAQVNYVDSSGQKHNLQAWRNEYDRNVFVDPGAEVEADGTVWSAVYDYSATGPGASLNKSVFKDSTVNVSIPDRVVTNCSSAGTYTETSIGTDSTGAAACVVKGKAETPEGVKEDVTVTYDGSMEVTYHFTVLNDFRLNQPYEPIVVIDYVQPDATMDKAVITKSTCELFDTGTLYEYGHAMIDGSGHPDSAYKAKCHDGGEWEVALCLDPGRKAPDGVLYKKSIQIDPDSKIGAMVKHLKANAGLMSHDYYRMGVNTAFRIAFAVDYGSSVTADFGNARDALRNGNLEGAVSGVFNINSHTETANVTREYLEIYLGYTPGENSDGNYEVKKVISETILSEDKNSYTIKYDGSKLYVPSYITIADGTYTSNGNGTFRFEVHLKNTGEKDDKNRKIYDMTGSYLYVPDINALVIPKAEGNEDGSITKSDIEAKQEAAAEVPISNDGALDIFVIAPQDGSARQRLLLFDEGDNKIYIYLDPADGDRYCNQIPALDVEKCAAKDSSCNYELFLQDCCSLINESDYPETYADCTNSCSTNTVGQVCEYVEFETAKDRGQTASMYEIREGVKYNNGGYNLKLGTCVVNINEFKAGESNPESFDKYDDVGNSRNLQAYADNTYCRITCKEDWDFSMGTFGSYMGKDAVSAGTYFSIDKADIFIKGDQSCYTSKMNEDTYFGDQKALAKQLPAAYNAYSKAAHELRDMLWKSETTTSKGNSVNHKDNSTYDKDKSSTGTACKGYNNVQLYHMEDDDNCVGSTDPDCTPTQSRVNDGDPVRLCSTKTEYEGDADGATDNEVDFKFIGWIQDSMKFVDDDGLTGKYRTYETSDGVSVSVAGDVAYSNLKATITCQGKDGGGTGENSADTITCTISGGAVSQTFDWDDIKATDSNLATKVNDRIVKNNNVMALNDTGHDSEVLKAFIEQNKEDLEGKMNDAKSKIVSLEAKLKSNANSWHECQNWMMVTTDYNGEDINAEDEKALAKSAYGIDDSFTALGTPKDPKIVSVAFNPQISYTYDEFVYMGLLDSNAKDAGHPDGIHDNILIPHDKKNGDLTLGQHLEKPINLLENKNAKVNLDYSYKAGKYYSSITNEDEYTGGSAGHSLVAPQQIVLCKAGQKGDNDVQGQTAEYSSTAGSDPEGWIKGNCYTVHLYTYSETRYVTESISNSSFYRNKGYWSTYANGVIAHGGDEEGKGTIDDTIDKYKLITGTDFPRDNTSKLKWSQLGSVNVFPVSMTTARNLYTYTYSFNNIGVYFAKKVSDTTRFARLMGTIDSVFRNNTRSCFYEVIEDICKCCGDPMEYHVTYSSKTDAEAVERFVDNHSSELRGATSNADKIKSNTSGELGLFNTVVSLGNLNTFSESDSGNERPLAANWGPESLFTYNGYSRYVTNKGAIAAKAIEYMGEEIYSANSSAEYAYRLTPEAITEIKSDNAETAYGTNYDKLKVYGAVQIAPVSAGASLEAGATWNMNKTDGDSPVYENMSFQHYGSVFLEDIASKYAKFTDDKGFTNYNLASRTQNNESTVCVIVEPSSDDGKTNYQAIQQKIKGGCRWVDYVETSADTIADFDGKDGSTFRLAFK